MDTNLYRVLRGTYVERVAALAEADTAWLRAAILDGEYNEFLRNRADYEEGQQGKHGHGKRLPYIGWYWRHIEFSDLLNIPIGDCGEFVGFIANNKWGYPERVLTEAEARAVMAIIDEAMRLNLLGGDVSKIEADTNAKLDELWDYMQTLEVR